MGQPAALRSAWCQPDLPSPVLQVFFSIILAAMGAGRAQMSFPDVAKAGSAMKSVFGILDAPHTASWTGEWLLWHQQPTAEACMPYSLLTQGKVGAQAGVGVVQSWPAVSAG